MTIKEVEQILGLPRATVRFYEKEGLIEPKEERMDIVIIHKWILYD